MMKNKYIIEFFVYYCIKKDKNTFKEIIEEYKSLFNEDLSYSVLTANIEKLEMDSSIYTKRVDGVFRLFETSKSNKRYKELKKEMKKTYEILVKL